MDADMVKCPHCGADVPCSLFSMTKSNAWNAGRNLRRMRIEILEG